MERTIKNEPFLSQQAPAVHLAPVRRQPKARPRKAPATRRRRPSTKRRAPGRRKPPPQLVADAGRALGQGACLGMADGLSGANERRPPPSRWRPSLPAQALLVAEAVDEE